MFMSKGKKKRNFIILILIFVISVLIYFLTNKDIDLKESFSDITGEAQIKNIKIVDQFSKSRPIAVMINNNHAAWPHAGLADAYITYEIIAEGGITRLMAIFKDKDTSKIGSVRSSRPYYLDYALENDAIYVHFGYSEDARSDISTLGVNNINGLTDESVFWRDTSLNKSREHTAFTSMEKIKEFSKSKGYDRDMKKPLLLKYSVDEIDLSKMEDSFKADSIFLKYSNYTNSSYEYDGERKVYKRSMSGQAHVDAITGEQYTYKNIVVAPLKNYSYDSYGRQKLENIGTFEGYYITNGYSVPITFTKESREGQTVYKYKDGSEIKFNDGNTFIQITPLGEEVKIEGNE